MKYGVVDMNRRAFLGAGLGAAVAAATTLSPRSARAAVANPVVVVVFLRGGVDALSVLPPRLGANRTTYLSGRPNIRVATPATITGAGDLGLHPALAKVRTLYEGGEAAFVLGAGSPNQTRSHFEQISYINGGDPLARRTVGYLDRALGALGGTFGLRAVALADEMPLSLRGTSGAVRISSLDGYGTLPSGAIQPGLGYADRIALLEAPATVNATATQIGRAAAGVEASIGHVQRIVSLAPAVSPLSTYGTSAFASDVRDAARIVAAEPRVRAVQIDYEGFDSHAMQGNDTGGDLRGRLLALDGALGAFAADAKRLGFWNRTCVVGISEFGRNVKENGSKGTDHGRGGVAFVMGPATVVRGRRVVAPADLTLLPAALEDGRDLRVTTDLRAVMGEVLTKHLAVPSLSTVFPGYTPTVPGLLA